MQVPSDLGWEVVVVNNGCTDHTDEIITSFVGRLPIRRELEPQRGLSRARNRAIDAANGEYIVWTDDDVIIDPGWLNAYVEAFRRWPEAAVFGGAIIPKYEAPVVEWVRQCEPLLGHTYGIRDLGDAPLRFSSKEGPDPYGANFAVRASEQRRFRYDTDLGLAPGRQRLGEESKVIGSILASGAIGYWLPDARIEHFVRHEQQSTAHIVRYFAAYGETLAFARRSRETGPRYFGVPRWLWRRVAESWVRYRWHRLVSPAPVWIVHLKRYGLAKGGFRYWWNR